ncbi:TetR/AcrR family transcriptional regulator [Microbacterium sp.]|uniref:TetR/AcrR family transcriptional regulator n=1 Tax=Microbacterium sp. TaxID=51671 RepID=UPI001AC03A38|nr:TetR/AcrR family transcriptional regulator [Microbacterium sp.]MBN9192757.1 TetR/AcrR family transcriptional regulator [Microbacterium sp.]
MADAVLDTHTAILDAALAEVLAHGIRRTTASDIARRAGVSRQTLYRYWPDAQALFAALVTRELLAALPPDGGEGPATLDDLVSLLADTAEAVRRMPLVDRLRDTDPELFARYILERLGTSQRAIHADLVVRIAGGQARGIVRAGDAAAMAAMVLLLIQSAIQSAPLMDEWLDAASWRTELALAVGGYLRPTSGRRG